MTTLMLNIMAALLGMVGVVLVLGSLFLFWAEYLGPFLMRAFLALCRFFTACPLWLQALLTATLGAGLFTLAVHISP